MENHYTSLAKQVLTLSKSMHENIRSPTDLAGSSQFFYGHYGVGTSVVPMTISTPPQSSNSLKNQHAQSSSLQLGHPERLPSVRYQPYPQTRHQNLHQPPYYLSHQTGRQSSQRHLIGPASPSVVCKSFQLRVYDSAIAANTEIYCLDNNPQPHIAATLSFIHYQPINNNTQPCPITVSNLRV